MAVLGSQSYSQRIQVFKGKQDMGKANRRSSLAQGGLALLAQRCPGAEGTWRKQRTSLPRKSEEGEMRSSEPRRIGQSWIRVPSATRAPKVKETTAAKTWEERGGDCVSLGENDSSDSSD